MSNIIPYEGHEEYPVQHKGLSGTFDDIGHAIAQMGRLSDSATELSDQLQAMLDDIKVTLPKAMPFVIAGGALLGTYLVTGTIKNIKAISSK